MSGHLPNAFRPIGHPTAHPPEESWDGKCDADGETRADLFVANGMIRTSLGTPMTSGPIG